MCEDLTTTDTKCHRCTKFIVCRYVVFRTDVKFIPLWPTILISIAISMAFVLKGPINNITALLQIMAWHRLGDQPLSETIMFRLPKQICGIRPQWVKWYATTTDNASLLVRARYIFGFILSLSILSNSSYRMGEHWEHKQVILVMLNENVQVSICNISNQLSETSL